MKKHLLIFIALISFPISMHAQTEKTINSLVNSYNKYLIKIDTNVTHNIQATGDYLKLVCVANVYSYNSTTKYYEIYTKRDLEYNIVSGKLQKNMTPIMDFQLVGKGQSLPAVTSNTISGQ